MQSPCDHEEADTRIVVHLVDALKKGQKTCLVRTVNTDVIVILIGKFYHLLTLNPNEWHLVKERILLIGIIINSVCSSLGEQKSLALPLFHSFTGCDTTSAFFGRGKKLAWEAWKCYSEVTAAFLDMAVNPYSSLDQSSPNFKSLERFTVIQHHRVCRRIQEGVILSKNRSMENIPPTRDALLQHSKRVEYQASIWTTSHLTKQSRPSPEAWGWNWHGYHTG